MPSRLGTFIGLVAGRGEGYERGYIKRKIFCSTLPSPTAITTTPGAAELETRRLPPISSRWGLLQCRQPAARSISLAHPASTSGSCSCSWPTVPPS